MSKDSTIILVKEGEQCKTLLRRYDKLEILHEVKDWVMEVHIDQQLRFLETVYISTQRPDIVIYS